MRRWIKRRLFPLADTDSIDRPIFIISPPRAGSTWLYEMLLNVPPLRGHRVEATEIWYELFPFGEAGDLVPPEAMEAAKLRELCRSWYAEAQLNVRRRGGKLSIGDWLGNRSIRMVDKSISNAFHVDLLTWYFPEAIFVILQRDPRAVLSSMHRAWGWDATRHDVASQILNREDPARGGQVTWSFTAPPGWKDHAQEGVWDISCWIWQQHMIAAERLRDCGASIVELRYESLLENAESELSRVLQAADLELPEKLQIHSQCISRTALSPPEKEKWRQDLPALEKLWPKIAEEAERQGYSRHLD